MRKLISLILVCGMIITMLVGCTLDNESSLNNDELSPVSSVTMGEEEANSLKDKSPVQLYFINEQGNKLTPETRYIDKAQTSKGNAYLATEIIKELVKGPAEGNSLKASIPKETKVNADVTIKDGVATVDFSKDFIEKHPGGKKNEQLTLYSIVNSLTEIKDIKSVQFKIDGKVAKEFKGSYQIDIAYPRTAYLIAAQPANDQGKVQGKDQVKDQVKDQSKDQSKDQGKDQKTNAEVEVEILE